MSEIPEKVTNQHLLLQIVKDIEVLKQNSLQILASSQDHETRIRELEKRGYQSQWVIALFTAVVTAAAVLALSNFFQF
jgi:LPS O-antigen subunit length determinant protein (WzzB/FepE family)